MGEADSFLEELCKGDERLNIELRRADEQLRMLRHGSEDQLMQARLHLLNAITIMIRQEYETKGEKIEYKRGPSSSIRRKLQSLISIDAYMSLQGFEDRCEALPVGALPEPKGIGRRMHKSKEQAEHARSLMMQIRALEKISEGRLKDADALLKKARMLEPTVSNSCLYCSFLDTAGRFDEDYRMKASQHWYPLTIQILFDDSLKAEFHRGPFSKNETARFRPMTLEESLVHLKRSRSREDIQKEARIAHFLYHILGDTAIVPQPLECIKSGEHFYLAHKIFPGRTLDQVLGVRDDNDQKALRILLRTLDHYQRAVAENRELSRKYGFEIPMTDYASEFDSKFIQRLCKDAEGIDAVRMLDSMAPVFDVLKSQELRGVHGDLHATNVLLHMMDRMCIIDSEKISLGAGVADWANLLTFTKVNLKTDLDRHARTGYETFARAGTSRDQYFLAYHCARLLKSAHMAGTAHKYGGSERDCPVSMLLARNALSYLDEAICSLNVLKELVPLQDKNNILMLKDEFTKVRRMHSP